MENEEKKLQEEKVKEATDAPKVDEKKKKPSKTWEAAMRLKGSLIVNDPKFLL